MLSPATARAEEAGSTWALGPSVGFFLVEEANTGRPLRLGGGPRLLWSEVPGLPGVELHADYAVTRTQAGSGPAVVRTWHHRVAATVAPSAVYGSVRLGFSAGPALTFIDTEVGHGTDAARSVTALRAGLLGAVYIGLVRPGLDARLELSSTTRAGRADVLISLVVPVPL